MSTSAADMASTASSPRTILITGGAGFIGVNAALHFARKGWHVAIMDNLSRRGADDNLRWLREHVAVRFECADIREADVTSRLVRDIRPDVLLHLAAQVAVTTSVNNPREDFAVNALGTLNVLEAVRLESPGTFVINASTNKVYGRMPEIGILERDGRYEYRDLHQGVDEEQRLDFHSPYGCSKGAGDQYAIDYSRIYGLQAVTFRQSCIYGPRQFGIEDQGWVAWFTIAAVLGTPITIYGNGKQVRDVLHVDDLIGAYEAAFRNRTQASGHAFNIGGGPAHTMSLRELVGCLEEELGADIPLRWSDWRPGDQPVFVCNVDKAERLLGWRPTTPVRDGVRQLIRWVRENTDRLGSLA